MAVVAVDVRQLPQTTTHVVARGAGYFPVIAHLGGESLAVVVRAGAAHIGLGGRLDVVLSADGGKTWGSPVCAAARSAQQPVTKTTATQHLGRRRMDR